MTKWVPVLKKNGRPRSVRIFGCYSRLVVSALYEMSQDIEMTGDRPDIRSDRHTEILG
jgi:hypothetical protein